jgi:hypothetical protein
MKIRGIKGGTLGFVVAAAVTIVLIGIGFYFLANIIGGSREHTNATDAGVLNVARFGLVKPQTTLGDNDGIELNNFRQLGDDDAGRPGGNRINLRNYNRCYAHALIVAVNAMNDKGPGNSAIKNAETLMARLQQGTGSIGGRLSAELQRKDGNVLFSDFEIANSNSVRMLGKESNVSHLTDQYRTSFLEQKPVSGTDTKNQATNVVVPTELAPLFSAFGLVTDTLNGKQYLRGYQDGTNLSGLTHTPIGVPVNPGQQPHLVSRAVFDPQDSRDKDDDIAFSLVPPNAFSSRSLSTSEVAARENAAVSWAVVGSLNTEFPASIPLGYIEVINGDKTTVAGPFVGENSWLQQEGSSERGGTLVSGSLFGNPAIMEEWKAFNEDTTGTKTQPSSASGIYVRSGNKATAATVAQAKNIKGALLQCTDKKVSGGPSGNSTCRDFWNNGNGAFDDAYYPGGNSTFDGTSLQGDGLTAVECADCQVEALFNKETSLTITKNGAGGSVSCPVTGLRVFKSACSDNMVTSPKGACKSTVAADIETLGNFASRPDKRYNPAKVGHFGTDMIAFIMGRIRQIKPLATKEEVDEFRETLKNTPVPLGARMYIYMDDPNKEVGGKIVGGKLMFNSSTPVGLVKGFEPDGTPQKRGISYSLQKGGDCGLMNPRKDFGIHDIMYYEEANPDFTGTDTAVLTPSSGFNNLLGRIEFTNEAVGTCSLFSEPD